MKKSVGLFAGITCVLMFLPSVYASDWDVAGKILTGVEGLRIITGGKVDIVGSMAGINRRQGRGVVCVARNRCVKPRDSYKRIWVPHYVWKKRWVSQHSEYNERWGEIIVEGHYIKYRVESGGHWEYKRVHRRLYY